MKYGSLVGKGRVESRKGMVVGCLLGGVPRKSRKGWRVLVCGCLEKVIKI